MRQVGYMDQKGMGIPLKILAGMRAHNGTDALLEEMGDELRVTLWSGPPGAGSP